MGLSISDAVSRTHIPATTIRYYDKKGVLPFVKHDPNGHRHFSEHDIEILDLISCLKDTGMELALIRKYVTMVETGNDSESSRQQIFLEQKHILEDRIQQDQTYLAHIEAKIAHGCL